MIRKTLSALVLLLVLAVLAVVGVLLPPWDDVHRGRWFLAAHESLRADHFGKWEKVLPSRTIPASSQSRSYERALMDLGTIAYEREGQTITLTEYLEREDIAGLMVLQGGKVRFEFYGKGITPESRFHIWSATKSFTATLIAMALYEGKIESLDDPISAYSPQFDGTAYGETSLRHLLMMSSGVDFKHFDYEPDRNDFYFDIVLGSGKISDWAAALGRRVPAGTDFNYLATDTHVLSTALKEIYGKPLADIASEKLWEPGGFSGNAFWSQDAEGNDGTALGHCCLAIQLQDFAHLGQLYLEDLRLGGRQTVPDNWFDMVSRTHGSFQEPTVDPVSGQVEMGYSFQFWLPPGYDNEFVARGAFGQDLWIDRKREFVIAQFSTGAVHDVVDYSGMMRAIGDAVTAGTAQ